MKIRAWVIVVAVIIIAVAATAIYSIHTNNNGRFMYKITYKDEFVPGATYVFYINEDYKVNAVKESYCSTLECIEKGNTSRIKKYTIKMSDKNTETFKSFILDLFDTGKTEIELSSLYINDNDEQIINVLKYNDEEFFNYYEK